MDARQALQVIEDEKRQAALQILDQILQHEYTRGAQHGLFEPPKGWWAVYPGSEKIDIGDKKAIAYFEYPKHAHDYIAEYWPALGYMEKVGDQAEVAPAETTDDGA